jgi:DNA-binding response OmpR family regulator
MKVLVIDDDPDVVEVVSLCFEMRWPNAEVVSAADGETGLEAAEKENPDIIILDIGLPDMDGFEVCRRIRHYSDVPIVMLTVRDQATDKVKGLELGADDYITKPFSHIELLARARAVLRRAQAMPLTEDQQPFSSGDLFIDFARREVLSKGKPVRLTPTEYHLLYHLVRNAGRVVRHSTLLEKVWGREYVDSSDYLKVHIQHLRQKLGDDAQNPRLIVTERGVGYMFVGDR